MCGGSGPWCDSGLDVRAAWEALWLLELCGEQVGPEGMAGGAGIRGPLTWR